MTSAISNSWRFGLLLTVLVLSGVLINYWERAGQAHVDRRALREFPAHVGVWQQFGQDERLNAETESVLRADDYLSRNYRSSDGTLASFYVGYYATQRNGATYHSPLNCLPGSGWEMREPAPVEIRPSDGAPAFQANRYIVQNGDDREMLVYWYEGRGRRVASEYWGKIYTVIDSARRRRSDGAMVRVMVPIKTTEAAALASASDLAAQAAAQLPGYVPN